MIMLYKTVAGLGRWPDSGEPPDGSDYQVVGQYSTRWTTFIILLY